MNLTQSKSMYPSTDWSLVSGFGTEGTVIREDLHLLIAGELDGDQINELLTDLVRDGNISTAAVPAITYLTGDLNNLTAETRLNCRYSACLILGIIANHQAEFTLPQGENIDVRRNDALRQLLMEASSHDLGRDWMVSIAAVILLMFNDEASYRKLVTGGHM